MSENKRKGKGFIAGIIVGGVVGALGALLTAPKPGRELRRDLSEQFDTISDKTQQIAGTVGQKTQEAVKVVHDRTSDWTAKAKTAASGITTELKSWRLVKETPSEAAATLEETEPK